MSNTVNLPHGNLDVDLLASGMCVFSVNRDKQLNYNRDLISRFCFAGKGTAVTPANTAEAVPPQQSPLLLEPLCR